MKKSLIFFGLILMAATLVFAVVKASAADTLSHRLAGKILLQVEDKGRAWYVNPSDGQRYSLGRAAEAFSVMRDLGIGITNANLDKIPVADANLSGVDTDSDGLSDAAEDSLGTDKNKADSDGDEYNDKAEIVNAYNPKGSGKTAINEVFSKAQAGRILLQVESHGEAWYVNPDNNKRYFLNRPEDAFNVMRSLGLGITNQNLLQVKDAVANSSTAEEKTEKKTSNESSSCASLDCLAGLVDSCDAGQSVIWNYKSPLFGMTIQTETSFTAKGENDEGLCILEQKNLSSVASVSEKDKQSLIASGTTEIEIQSSLKSFNDSYKLAAGTVSTCTGSAVNLKAYFKSSNEGTLDASCSIKIESGSTSDVCVYNGNVTCVTKVLAGSK